MSVVLAFVTEPLWGCRYLKNGTECGLTTIGFAEALLAAVFLLALVAIIVGAIKKANR